MRVKSPTIDQVERAVVELRLGADLHAAAEEAAVADRRHQHAAPLARAAVEGEPDVGVVVGRPASARVAPRNADLAAEALRRGVGAAGDGAREAERRDVDEVARRRRAPSWPTKRDAAGVDDARRRRRACAAPPRRRSCGQLERAPEVAARAARDDAQLGRARRRPPRRIAVGDLGDRPVAAERDDERPPAPRPRAARWRVASRGAGREDAVELAQPVGERADAAAPSAPR